MYVKPKNEVFARHLLATRRQESSESLDAYLQALKSLGKDCNFQAVTANQNRDDYIRDSFINGLQSNAIRQRLLENETLTLQTAFDQARALESAQKQSASYSTNPYMLNAAESIPGNPRKQDSITSLDTSTSSSIEESTTAATTKTTCYFCGNEKHPRFKCPAKEETCHRCQKRGHFSKVCKSAPVRSKTSAFISSPTLAAISATATPGPTSLQRTLVKCNINGTHDTIALLDTGSSDSYIDALLAKQLDIRVIPCASKVKMADSSLNVDIKGYSYVTVRMLEQEYKHVKFLVLESLCAPVLFGHDFLGLHSGLEVAFGGSRPPLRLSSVTPASVDRPLLFKYLTTDCHPIAVKSRRFSQEDCTFIRDEVNKLLEHNIIEPSGSPWRAQVLVTKDERHKKRMVVDYSQTINRFTQLDAYPLPRIHEMVEKIAQYHVYTTLDLKSAYHQVPIREDEKQYTGFEADQKLYQFTRIPFGVTNGVAAFQRTIDNIITENNLSGTFAYVDNVTVCGMNQQEHDENLQRFLKVATEKNLELNNDKSIYSTTVLNILGYTVSNKSIKPDPERLQPLLELPIPKTKKELERVLGMFSYYAQWIQNFSTKVHPLVASQSFPLSRDAIEALETLKEDISSAVVVTVDKSIPLVVETDASDIAIAATLNQNGRPVAFFSRTLSPSEKLHPAVEKEAYAIVEAVRKWKHYLLGNHFKLVTDQRSVSFMFDKQNRGKIKNEKIQRWRIELASFSYDIVYRSGEKNVAPDAFSRIQCSMVTQDEKTLKQLHESLCHPGVTRMIHFVKCRNLPYSVDDVRKLCKSCPTCAELKPRYPKVQGTLIKATHPLERLNIDFKGPLPSSTRNRYLLVVIDEYSRFPWAFPCQNVDTDTVIKCLTSLFSTFGLPGYVHSDRGTAFMSKELTDFLHSRGIATSRTTAYNPQGNGQTERYNGVIWKALNLALKSQDLPVTAWEHMLPDTLHSIRSLLCTATNETPHERMFTHQRRSASGSSVPTWLTKPGRVFLRRHVRASKYEPLVEEVELLQAANPTYAHVRLPDGRETTVSVRHLAPKGEQCQDEEPTVPDAMDNNIETVDNATDVSFTEQPQVLTRTIPSEQPLNSQPSDFVPSRRLRSGREF